VENQNWGMMSRNNRKIIRELEALKKQIERLKENYLLRLQTLPEGQSPVPAKQAESAEWQEKNEKLLQYAIRTGNDNALYKTVSHELKKIIRSGEETVPVSALKEVLQKMEKVMKNSDHSEIFLQKFQKLYPHFFDHLLAAHPDLSKTEQKFCAYLRIRLNSHQIAQAMDVSMEAVRKNRYRIRKKLQLQADDSLEDYIARF
jgi:DNA-binding CsgD family transcriptional regulator